MRGSPDSASAFSSIRGSPTRRSRVARTCSAERAWCAAGQVRSMPPATARTPIPRSTRRGGGTMPAKKRCEWTSARLLDDRPFGLRSRRLRQRADRRERTVVKVAHGAALRRLSSATGARRRPSHARCSFSCTRRCRGTKRFPISATGSAARPCRKILVRATAGRRHAPCTAARRRSWITPAEMNFYRQHAHRDHQYPQDRSFALSSRGRRAVRSVPCAGRCLADQHAGVEHRRRAGGTDGGQPSTMDVRAAGIVQLREQTVLLRRTDHRRRPGRHGVGSAVGGARSVNTDRRHVDVQIRTTAPREVRHRFLIRLSETDGGTSSGATCHPQPAIVGTGSCHAPAAAYRRGRGSGIDPAGAAGRAPNRARPGSRIRSSSAPRAEATPSEVPKPRCADARHRACAKVACAQESATATRTATRWTCRSHHGGARPLSKLRRLGMKLHLAGDISGSVAIRWTGAAGGPHVVDHSGRRADSGAQQPIDRLTHRAGQKPGGCWSAERRRRACAQGAGCAPSRTSRTTRRSS